jgi:hypothetical protein
MTMTKSTDVFARIRDDGPPLHDPRRQRPWLMADLIDTTQPIPAQAPAPGRHRAPRRRRRGWWR